MHQLRFLAIFITLIYGCQSASIQKQNDKSQPIYVELNTSFGKVVIELSNETPLHRDNFVKLVQEGYLDSLLFHRVIEGFGIQSGDPDSKHASPGEALGNGGPDYTIPAEINDSLFHKRGVILAARDNNPERASSGSQFFIVQGKVQTDSMLDKAEERINGYLAQYYFVNDVLNKPLRDSLEMALNKEDEESASRWGDSIRVGAENYTNFEKYVIPESHREVYKTIGGAPHLDQSYTVFGEVTEGMNIVDSIAAMEVDSLARPFQDVRILSAKILKE
ncbi:MAG TPA: peptidylprolyl isomerase [Draconibacterium sp.]|nr:peptidylprolyl isomerase [Draconibacterium sp.]